MSYTDCKVHADLLIGAVMHLFDSKIVNTRTQLILMRDPMLVDCNSSISASELRESLAACAEQIGVGYATLDSRLLFRYPLKTTYGNNSTNMSNSIHDHTLLTTNIEEVVRKAPCILHIESFDAVFHDPAQQHASNPDDSQEELFLRAFQTFINDLYSSIESNYHSANRDTTDINQRSIVLVVSTNQSSSIKPRLKALFSAEVKLPQTSITQFQFAALLQQCNVCTANDGVSAESSAQKIVINADAEKLLYNHVHTHALSYASAAMLIEEVKKRTIARVDSPTWIYALGMETTKIPIQPETQSTTDTEDSLHIHISASDVNKTLSKIPCLNAFDTTSGLESKKGGQKQASIAPVHWADIGGLDRVRGEILEVLELPFKYPELFFPGCPRRQGVLLYGPPGTGKTLVARAVATECGMAFISVKGPELLDMYVGESEKNVREVFSRAREAAPCVLFFDEIDSLAPARAKGNASGGGIMDRMVSQLLTEMDMVVQLNAAAVTSDAEVKYPDSELASAEETSSTKAYSDHVSVETTVKVTGKLVFIIAATNRPDLLDPALLRPGRFDRKIYLGVCKDIPARLQILRAQTRKFTLSSSVDLQAVAETLPLNVTGADIGGVTSTAYGVALKRKLAQLRNQAMLHLRHSSAESAPVTTKEPDDFAVQAYINQLDAQELTIIVEQEDLLFAARNVQPSVVDLDYYESLGDVYDDTRA